MREPSVYMSDTVINELMPRYLLSFKKDATREKYYSAVCLFCDFIKKDFLDADKDDIYNYVYFLKKQISSEALSKKTVLARISYLNGFAKYISLHTDFDYINYFTSIVRPSIEGEPDVPTDMIPSMRELDMILTAAKSEKMWYLIISLCIKCALSASEVVKLKESQLVHENNNLYIFFSSDSAYENDRYVKLPDDIRDMLLSYIDNLLLHDEQKHLFYNSRNNVLTLKNLDDAIRRIVDHSGVVKKYTLKSIRSRAILSMIQTGADPNDVAEYSGISTLRISQFVAVAGVAKDTTCPADLLNFIIKQP